jgi:hypothetical protein
MTRQVELGALARKGSIYVFSIGKSRNTFSEGLYKRSGWMQKYKATQETLGWSAVSEMLPFANVVLKSI